MNAVLFHGTGGTPDSCWFPYMKRELEKRGFTVSVPALPNTDAPQLKESLARALQESYDEDTLVIGHSSGVPLILSVLENIDVKIKQAILVAGFFERFKPDEPEPMLQDSYDWEKIRSRCGSFVVINSDDDPWGCDDVVGRKLAENLDGEFVLAKGEGHMGSMKFNQPYKEFPLLLSLVK